MFGIIAGFGLTFVSDLLLDYQEWLRIGGAGFLLLCRDHGALRADPLAGTQSQRDPETLLADFVSTFALTMTNPITILAFLAIFAGIGFTGAEATLGRRGDPRPRGLARLAVVVGRRSPLAPDAASLVSPQSSGLDQPRLGRDIGALRGRRCSAACWCEHLG